MSSDGAQTWTVIPGSDLAPGETASIDLANSKPDTPTAQPSVPKQGYLGKIGPFDGVVFDSYSSERMYGSADGTSIPVPADSARTVDSNSVGQFVKVTNPASNANTVAAEDMQIILFGRDEADAQGGLQFGGAAAVIGDVLPGVRTTDG